MNGDDQNSEVGSFNAEGEKEPARLAKPVVRGPLMAGNADGGRYKIPYRFEEVGAD